MDVLTTPQTYTAFSGHQILARGRLDEVVLAVKRKAKSDVEASLLVFSDTTGKQMDFDLRGSEKEVLKRLQVYLSEEGENPAPAGPGRPKLGVVAREVSLLPRHWEWLSTQSGGASATLRRLVEDARKSTTGRERIKQSQECAHRFMTAIAGNHPDFEEALRALYSKDRKKLRDRMGQWPEAIRYHALALAAPAFEE